mgnify:CR=1 FL=1
MHTRRNIGIDLLKIVSMLMIVTLHMLGHGGILEQVPVLSGSYQLAWLLEIICYGAVNCYALASGFLTARCNIRKIMELWMQVIFYSLIITILMDCTVLHGTISREEWIYSFFPVTSRKSWYVTAYFGMMCLMPVIRLAVDYIDQRLYRHMLMGIFAVYIVLPTLVSYLLQGTYHPDPVTLNRGYSSLWLCVMYLLGAYIRKYVDYYAVKKRISLLVFGCMVMITFLSKMLMERTGNVENADVLVDYTSPTIVLGSIALLMFFVNIRGDSIKIKQMIVTLSGATLGVYLIHDNDLIRNEVVAHLFEDELINGMYKWALVKLIIAVPAVYVICSMVDLIRGKLFECVKRAVARRQAIS